MRPQPKQNLNPNVSQTSPTGRKPGIYQLNCEELAGGWYCNAYRDGRFLVTARARTAEQAVSEARRGVRYARKCGGCK